MPNYEDRKFALIPYASVTSDHISNSIDSSINDMRRSIKSNDDVICIFDVANVSAFSGYEIFDYKFLNNVHPQ